MITNKHTVSKRIVSMLLSVVMLCGVSMSTLGNVFAASTYKIVYDANGGSGSVSTTTHTVGTTSKISSDTYTRANYKFKSWNTKKDGTGTTYKSGASVKNLATSGSVRLYAQWSSLSQISVSYDNHYTEKKVTIPVQYKDTYFSSISSYESERARASIALASAAYNEDYAKAALQAMDYKILASVNYNRACTKTSNDFVAYTVGKKVVKLGSTTYNLYCIDIKGTSGDYQWYSNFNIGKNGKYHEGFKKASDEVYNNLSKYIKTSEKANNKIWIMGHSRGAAVTNILATSLCKSGAYASASNVFAYSFACPTVATSVSTSYSGVRVYNNPGDFIASVPLAKWGFKANGKITTLSTSYTIFEKFKKLFKAYTGEKYSGKKNLDSCMEAMEEWVPSVSDYYKNNKYGFAPKDIFYSLADFMMAEGAAQTAKAVGSLASKVGKLALTGKQGLKGVAALAEVGITCAVTGAITDAHTPECYITWVDVQCGSFLYNKKF